ncbi:MAG: hypothetical protein WD342_07730 [Verrucomicrobiales bacterium]
MKLTALFCSLVFTLGAARANSLSGVADTHANTLNNLIRRLPALSLSYEDDLEKLSAIQEQLVLHELRMRGEGLPSHIGAAFSVHYSAILSALVDDRITEDYGRELLSIHRQLLDRTYDWIRKPEQLRDEDFGVEVVDNLNHFLSELQEKAAPLAEVPHSVRTPVINGYQAWVGELLAWGEYCCGLNPGELSGISHALAELERFEGYYKEDGVLANYERENLHGRFIKMTRKTIDILRR